MKRGAPLQVGGSLVLPSQPLCHVSKIQKSPILCGFAGLNFDTKVKLTSVTKIFLGGLSGFLKFCKQDTAINI